MGLRLHSVDSCQRRSTHTGATLGSDNTRVPLWNLCSPAVVQCIVRVRVCSVKRQCVLAADEHLKLPRAPSTDQTSALGRPGRAFHEVWVSAQQSKG